MADGTAADGTTAAAPLTIGAFARTSRLSIKALRLYDEIGLLRPAWTDPDSGYRYYEPGQLDRARLVAWLRRLGMPLARIRHVCDLCETDRGAAANEIREFWLRVETDTAARRELVDFLIEQLSGKDDTMPSTTQPLQVRYAALSDQGTVRPDNQDAAYAGPRLFAVADGFGERGDTASSTAIDLLRTLDAVESGDLLNVLNDAADRAHQAVGRIASEDSGTTLTAMLWTGSELGLVHIGDSRAYLLRDGRFFQITHDHTLVQSMLDDGRITPQEAESHPQRSLLVQALGTGQTSPEPQVRVTDVRAGDRYLLCTDGLSARVAEAEIRSVVEGAEGPADAVAALVELSIQAGGADNVACVVAIIG
ncbi:MerR family transcriptional regulator [Actinospica sp.]|uniref:MerR family transcriptional regulator n=1 Tax=Actinospica sp. TaxID=1872142 RepID=UPI002C627CF4|nr:MerR family transcriptional regulator [Actinospica sp.]HWG26234.1 MerR family transcriptional regulator [Actinospica sp.]